MHGTSVKDGEDRGNLEAGRSIRVLQNTDTMEFEWLNEFTRVKETINEDHPNENEKRIFTRACFSKGVKHH